MIKLFYKIETNKIKILLYNFEKKGKKFSRSSFFIQYFALLSNTAKELKVLNCASLL